MSTTASAIALALLGGPKLVIGPYDVLERSNDEMQDLRRFAYLVLELLPQPLFSPRRQVPAA